MNATGKKSRKYPAEELRAMATERLSYEPSWVSRELMNQANVAQIQEDAAQSVPYTRD